MSNFDDIFGNENKKSSSEPAQTDSMNDIFGGPRQKTEEGYDFGKVGGRALSGAVMGVGLPETTYALGSALKTLPYAPAKLGGAALQSGAPFLNRWVGAGVGGISGAGGELTEQALKEEFQASPTAAKLGGMGAEFLIGPLTEATGVALKFLGTKAGRILSGLATKDSSTLSSAERETKDKLIEQLRQGEPAAAAVFDKLKSGASEIEQAGQQESKRLFTQSETYEPQAESVKQTAKQNIQSVGNPQRELTDIGEETRSAIKNRYDTKKLEQDADYKATKQLRDEAVADQESNNKFVTQTPEYKQLNKKLEDVLLIGKINASKKTLDETEKRTLSAYQEMWEALQPKKIEVSKREASNIKKAGGLVEEKINKETGEITYERTLNPSFNAIDTVRRKLGDVAFGEGEEGFKALGQNLAKDFYFRLAKMQERYAGAPQKTLQSNYEMHQNIINEMEGGLGGKVLKTDKISPEEYTILSRDVPNKFFKDKNGPARLSALTGDPALTEKLISDFSAINVNKLETSAQVKNWMKSNSELLSAPEAAKAKTALDKYVQDLESAESQAQKLTTTGKLTAKESEQALKQAQNKVDTILKDRFPEQRIIDLMNSKSLKEWQEVSSILSKSKDGVELLGRAVRQHLGNVASTSPGGALEALSSVAEPLTRTGLMSQSEINKLQELLQTIDQPDRAKLNLITSQILKGLYRNVGGQTVGQVFGAVPSMFGGQ